MLNANWLAKLALNNFPGTLLFKKTFWELKILVFEIDKPTTLEQNHINQKLFSFAKSLLFLKINEVFMPDFYLKNFFDRFMVGL